MHYDRLDTLYSTPHVMVLTPDEVEYKNETEYEIRDGCVVFWNGKTYYLRQKLFSYE